MKARAIQLFRVNIFLAVMLLIAGCGEDIATQKEQHGNDDIPAGATLFSSENMPVAASRTTLVDHTKGSGANVLWEAGDYIWVKDDGGTFRQSSSTTASSAEAVFSLTTGSFTGTTHSVVYTGKNSTSATEVEIKAAQTQTVTNSFAHLGESGDCGIATAKIKSSGAYKFTLEHKAAYLCIYPRIADNEALRKNVRLSKVVIKSTSGPIAGKYDFSAGSLSTSPTSAASNTITLTTTSGEIPSATRADTCYYAVIAPGNHTLKAEYHVEDPSTNVSKVIVKDLGTVACDAGKFTDVTAWIDKELIEFNSFYLWDAKKPYWYGFEDVQPFTNGANNPNYPKPGDSDRYTNPRVYPATEGSYNPLFMSSSARHVPSMNEMSWYLAKGAPRKDAAGVYVFRGHLQQGRGVWIKKMSKIIADNAAEVAAAGGDVKEMGIGGWAGSYNDYRTTFGMIGVHPSNTPLTVDEQVDYFFLPFNIGVYSNGTYYAGTTVYWTSTPTPMGDIYVLYEESNQSLAVYYGIGDGNVAVPFL